MVEGLLKEAFPVQGLKSSSAAFCSIDTAPHRHCTTSTLCCIDIVLCLVLYDESPRFTRSALPCERENLHLLGAEVCLKTTSENGLLHGTTRGM